MSQTGKIIPNLDQNSTKILNLTVLQRMDPYIEEILITASHVTFYEFNVDLNQWSRKDVEGSLFVVKRNAQPRFQFIVMNRRSTENLVENLLGDFEFELQVPYLLYRNASQEVNGIWFYNSRESEDVANLFTRILGAYSKVSPKQKTDKSEFEELEAMPTSGVTEGSLEPTLATSRPTDVLEDSSFANFFSTKMNLQQNAPNPLNSMLSYHNLTTAPLPSRDTPSPLYNGPPLKTPLNDNPHPTTGSNRPTNLIKPLPFFTPSLSPAPLMPQPTQSPPATAIQPPPNVQRRHSIPLLQPFPPPTPLPSPSPATFYGPLSREKVREALLMLVQDDRFIDMFYQALLKAHQS